MMLGKKVKSILLLGSILLVLTRCSYAVSQRGSGEVAVPGITQGMSQKDVLLICPKASARTYRTVDNQEWMTFNFPLDNSGKDYITLHFVDNTLEDWALNDQKEVTEEILSEYCSQSILHYLPKTREAITRVFRNVPHDVFMSLTDRARPILFTEYHYTGMGRFANTSEIFSFEDDAPSFMDGLTIVKLSTELEDLAESADPIAGVVAHEMAHRYLEHAKKKTEVCEREREANHLIQAWGFEKEFEKARIVFGDPKEASMRCPEENKKQLP